MAAATLVLGSVCTPGIAQDLDFKNLPGVVQQTGPAIEFKDSGNAAKT
jgi:hypothetical protein